MTSDESERARDFVVGLMERASTIALDVYRSEFTSSAKSDSSPVTEADRRVNEFLVDAIGRRFPNDVVVGEESDFQGGLPAEGRAWFIDPIDGTKDFILKNGEWSIMVGLAVDGHATLGVVAEPAFQRIYAACSGGGAERHAGGRRDRLVLPATKPLAEAVVINSRNHPDPLVARLLQTLGVTHQFEHGSIGCKLARIAEGRADAYFNFSGRCHVWDTCAGEVILREAGGDVLNGVGARLEYRGTDTRVRGAFFAASPAVLPAVAAAVQTLVEAAES